MMDQRIHALRTAGAQTDGCGCLSIFVLELMILLEFKEHNPASMIYKCEAIVDEIASGIMV